MSEAAPAVPKIGLIPVLDPRIDPQLEKQLLDPLSLESKLQNLGIEVLSPTNKLDRQGRALPRSSIFFTKDGRLCCISVKSAGTGRGNLITVLVKD